MPASRASRETLLPPVVRLGVFVETGPRGLDALAKQEFALHGEDLFDATGAVEDVALGWF